MRSTIIFLSILAIIIALAVMLNRQSATADADYASYQSWTNTYRYNMTFEQWRDLRNNDLLPPEPKPIIPFAR